MLTKPSVGDEVMYQGVGWYVQWTDGNVAYLLAVDPDVSEGPMNCDEIAVLITDLEVA